MKLDVFVMCDAATEWMGKLNLLGTFDTIRARRSLPIVYPQCAIAGRLRFDRIERGQHTVRVAVVDMDGQRIVPPVDATLNANFPDTLSSAAVNFIINLQKVRFERFGEYAIDLAVDGRQEASLPLSLMEIVAPAPGGGATPPAPS